MVARRAIVAGLAVALAGALGASAAAGPVVGPFRPPPREYPPAEAAVFLEQVLRQIVRNDYASAWLTLHPAQQQAIPRAPYVRCELASPVAARLVWAQALRVVARAIVVPGGQAEPVPAQAVTFRLRLATASSSGIVTQTVHTVPVEGRWTWMLPPQRFELHRSGSCLRRA